MPKADGKPTRQLSKIKGDPTSRTDPILGLAADYFFTADLMHTEVHKRRERFFAYRKTKRARSFTKLEREFMIYVNLWLSTLWVVAHAIRHVLKVGPEELHKLIDEHFRDLSDYRNATFHYHRTPDKHVKFFHGQMNWAEELHDTIHTFLADYANNLAVTDREHGRASRKRRPSVDFN